MSARVRSGRWRRAALEGARRVAVGLVLAYTVVPILWVIAVSLRDPVRTMTIPPQLLVPPTFRYYRELFAGTWGDFTAYYANSAAVCGAAVALALAMGTPAAFALSRSLVGQRWASRFLGAMALIY